MPTNQNAYNSRVTDEALEKKFRDVFKSQGGAELVNDLYASGVIVPIVDFSAAAGGSVLSPELQQAWDFSTGDFNSQAATTTTIINNTGFWKIDLTVTGLATVSAASPRHCELQINDGATIKRIWGIHNTDLSVNGTGSVAEGSFVVFLRAGDSLEYTANVANSWHLSLWYRQIADVSGNLVNPLGFTSS